MTPATQQQPDPRPGGVSVTDLMLADPYTPIFMIPDFIARRELGRERYGVELTTHNGRDALVDALQEGLDQCLYLRQVYEEVRSENAVLGDEIWCMYDQALRLTIRIRSAIRRREP